MLARAADVLAKERGAIESQITADMGKTLTESGGELDEAIGYLRFAAAEGRRREGDVNPNGVPGRMSFTLRGPLGVVGVITAWNFPVAIPLWKLAAGLLTGNTCVWKPASATAMTGTLLADALDRAGLLPGVLNLVHGRGSVTGDAIVHAPWCGSCPSQARLRQGCRSPLALRRAVGAPSSRWAARTRPSCSRTPISSWPLRLWSLARLGPQGNAALRRAGSFVESSVRDEFAQLLTEGARRLRCGDGRDPETDVGPPVDAQSRDQVADSVAAARARGAQILSGGARVSGDVGCFYAPTVLGDVGHADPIAREEVFGPVTVLLDAPDRQTLVTLANDTPTNLSHRCSHAISRARSSTPWPSGRHCDD